MSKDREIARELFITAVQGVVESQIGIRPLRKQVDKYVGEYAGIIRQDSPPWMHLVHPDSSVRSN